MRDLAKTVVLGVLRGYQRAISPVLRPACRYVPTCSEYAMEAVDRYGVMYGGVKAIWRLLRCHPLGKGGFDPVLKNADAGCSEAIVESREFCSH